MGNRLFIQYLDTFNKGELQRFLQSMLPTFKKKAEKDAFSYVIENKLSGKEIDEDRLAELLLAKGSSQSRVLKKFFSICSQLTEEFLVGHEMKKEDYKLLRSMVLLRRLTHHKEEALFNHNLKKTAKYLQKEERSDILSLLSSVLLMHETFFHPLFERSKLPENNNFHSYPEQINKLEKAFLLNKYKYAVTETVRSRLEKKQLEEIDLNYLLEQEIRFTKEEFPLLHVYRLSLSIFNDFEENAYKELKKDIKELIITKSVSGEEQEIIFRVLVNHTAQAIRFNKAYLEDGYENYRFGITHRLLLQSGYLPQEHFFNYVSLSCSFGRIKTAKRFVMDYRDQLVKGKKDQVTQIAEALILLAENKFDEAFHYLYEKNFKDPHLRLMARSNRLIACYDHENKNKEAFLAVSLVDELESFKRVVSRLKGVLGSKNERIIANENLIKMIRSLEKARNQVAPSTEKLLTQLGKFSVIACRKWLGQKIMEL